MKIQAFLCAICVTLGACGPSGGPVVSDPNGPLTDDEKPLTAQQLLGKRLFEDDALSEPGGTSCQSCHDPAKAYTGDNGSGGAVPKGARALIGTRNSATLLYASGVPFFLFTTVLNPDGSFAGYKPVGGLTFDGRSLSLTEQAMDPFLDPAQLANASKQAVVAKVMGGAYATLFRNVNGQEVFENIETAYGRIADSLAAYEKTSRFHPYSSKFDQFQLGRAQLSAQEMQGLTLFQDAQKGNCAGCHAGSRFTDDSWWNLGTPRNPRIAANSDPTFFDEGLCQQPDLTTRAPFMYDIQLVCGYFRVPTLRNVAATGPYMHNGAFASLRDAVKFHATRDASPDLWYPPGQPYNDVPAANAGNVVKTVAPFDRGSGTTPRLDDTEIDAIVAFLGTLTDH